jgi:hypothetical protein
MPFVYEIGANAADARVDICADSVYAEFASGNWLCKEKSPA